jgi:hypothetical protein
MAQAPIWKNIATSDVVGTPEDISDEITELAPWDTMLLTAVGLNSLLKPCTSATHLYQEIQERPLRTTLNGGISAGGTTFILTDKVAIASDLIQVNEELVLLGSTSDNLTFTGCSRSKGVGADADHLTGAPVLVLGKARAQGAAAGSTSDLVVMPDQITTYTRIFTKDIVVTRTANGLDRYGRGTATEYDYVAQRQLKAIKKELEHCLLWDYDVAPSGVTTASQFNGIYERVSPVNTSDLSDAAATLTNMRTAVRTLRDYGARADIIPCSFYMADVFDSWGQAHVVHNTDPMDDINQTYGTSVSRLKVGGGLLNILPMDIISAHLFVLTSSNLGVGPLAPSQGTFSLWPVGREGDRVKAQVIGEYTAEIRAPRSHYVFTSVKAS